MAKLMTSIGCQLSTLKKKVLTLRGLWNVELHIVDFVHFVIPTIVVHCRYVSQEWNMKALKLEV